MGDSDETILVEEKLFDVQHKTSPETTANAAGPSDLPSEKWSPKQLELAEVNSETGRLEVAVQGLAEGDSQVPSAYWRAASGHE
jgi:hypothetical protein